MDCESYNVGNVAKNAMQYETLGEARKRELLQYLAEYLIEESELHGRALPPVAAEVVRDERGRRKAMARLSIACERAAVLARACGIPRCPGRAAAGAHCRGGHRNARRHDGLPG